MKILAIVQARVGATRLPGKVLLKLADKTVFEHVVLRVKKSKLVDDVVVATSTESEDDKLAELCNKQGFKIFRGSLNDVLDRYYQAAKLFRPKHVVRITADCPVIDPKVIDLTIQTHLNKNADYTANQMSGETYPDGEDVEVFSFKTLETAWKNARLASEREHVTLYINNNPHTFRRVDLPRKPSLSKKRWTLDEPEDYEFLKIVYKNLYPKNHFFGMEEILDFLKKHPEVEKINSHIGRNEGLAKSLREDKLIR